MPGDASASEGKRSATGRVAIGPYVLEVGDPAGSVLTPAPEAAAPTAASAAAVPAAAVPAAANGDSHALARALAREGKRRRKASPGTIETAVDDASAVTSRVEYAVNLCNELVDGRLDLQSASDEVGGLIDLLQRLDREERWKEALKVARCLSTLAALVGRWIELLRSLQTALHAAQELGDQLDEAWALHELGTLHLAAGRHADADDRLGRAREIRERCGDRRGLDVTDRNLQMLCRALRRQLHRRGHEGHEGLSKSLRLSPVAASFAAATLVVVGGAAGAMIDRSAHSSKRLFHAAAVAFSFTPSAPHRGQRVVFTATANDRKDPVASYTWRWGDGDPSGHRVQTHVYRASRSYEATVIVRDADGRVTGKASRLVVVLRPPFPGPNAAFSYEPRSPLVGEPIAFDARASYDAGANIVDYAWDFGDGKSSAGPVVSHSYSEARPYLVTLKVTDSSGRSNTLRETAAVGSHPGLRPAQIALLCPPSSVTLEEAVPVSGSIAPPRPGATLTVAYTGPLQHRFTAQAVSAASGFYETSETPDAPGQWSVQSSWAGDSEYLPGASEACTFSVNAPALHGRSQESPAEAKAEKEMQREKRELKEQVVREPQLLNPQTEPPANAPEEEPPASAPEEPRSG